MITREQLRQLAELQCEPNSAISFYFQPETPQDQSHRREAILVKDIAREALHRAGANGGKSPSKKDIERILTIAENMNGNSSRAKAIFACEAQGVWQEFDLPARLSRTEMIVNRRFHLKPLAAMVDAPRVCVAVLDRKNARIFELWLDEVQEVEDIRFEMPRVGRSDGFAGYEAGHIDRHVENEAMRHFKSVFERLLERYNAGQFDKLVLGIRDDVYGQAEEYLHPYLRNCMIGRFSADVQSASPDFVRDEADRIYREHARNRQQLVLHEISGEANRDGRGAVGLRDVLAALERREVQTLLIGDGLKASGVECSNCGHLDTRTGRECAVCGQSVQEIEDISDGLVSFALRNGADILYVTDDEALASNGHVAALLRFRADQNTPAKIAS